MLAYQIEFTSWANQRILETASKLTAEELSHDFKSSEKSILGTLVHIYRAERLWLARIQKQVVSFRVDGDDTLLALQSNWPKISGEWMEWAATLLEESWQADLTYHDLRNNQWTHPIWKIILHVVNHSSHHRGQVSGFIRALGHTPPSVDSISFVRGQ